MVCYDPHVTGQYNLQKIQQITQGFGPVTAHLVPPFEVKQLGPEKLRNPIGEDRLPVPPGASCQTGL